MSDVASDRLAALSERGARRYDPVRFQYLESLIRRDHGGRALSDILDAFEQALEMARQQAAATIKQNAANPADRESMQRSYQQGDYKAVLRLARIPSRSASRPHDGSPLARLTERLRTDTDGQGDNNTAGSDASPLDVLLRQQRQQLGLGHGSPARGLRALAAIRASRARQHTARRIHDSIAQPTGDAGPLNAHRQLVRALERLHHIAPDYLERFVGYVDTLMALEKAAPRKDPPGKDGPGRK